MSIDITADGVPDLQHYFQQFPKIAATAMSRAINDVVAQSGRSIIKKEMQRQVAFPHGYLDLPDRLKVTRYASPQRLEARLTGRDRPTSLARFAPSGTPVSRGGSRARDDRPRGIAVAVHPGQAKFFRGGFLLLLNKQNGNIGFAIRTGATPPSAAYKPQEFRIKGRSTGLWLLYGPSVDQVMTTVAEEVRPELISALESEFTRQFALLNKGGNF